MKRSSPEMDPRRADLAEITDSILDPDSDFTVLRDATTALHSLCSTIVGLSEETDASEADRETRLDEGRALSPRDAARCILDFARTTAFLRGIYEAITHLRDRFPGERINLVYAGCGPFAPLALPLTTRFSSEELRMTLLDAHEYSIESVRCLGESFGISASFSALRCCDAMDYTHPDSERLHLVVIETMQKALEHEPQVALTRRLAPQLVSGGILIPERVRLAACLADMSAEFSFQDPDRTEQSADSAPQRRRVDLGTLLELTANRLRFGPTSADGLEDSSTITLVIPDAVVDVPDLMVRTTVQVFGDHRLDDYDSGITYPTLIHHLGRIRAGDHLEFTYEEGPSPVLRIARGSPAAADTR